MSVCSNCGAKLESGVKFCTRCGTAVQKNVESPQKVQAETFNHQTLTDTNENDSFIKTNSMQDIPKTKNHRTIVIIIAAVIVLIAAVGIVTKGAAPLRARYNIMLGNKYLKDGKYEEAILAFQKVIQIEPKNVEARVELAKLYIKTSKPDEAEKILKEAIGINPKKVEPYLELAKLYITENNPVNAIKILADGYKATNDESIKSMLEDLKSKIIVDYINNTIVEGENYSLPNEVTVEINNVSAKFPVKWEKTTVDTTKTGTQVIYGVIEECDKQVKLTISVVPAIVSIENIDVTVKQGEKYSLPQKVKAKMRDQSEKEVEVVWNPSNADTAKEGIYVFNGTMKGYKDKVILNLVVKSTGITVMGKDIEDYSGLTENDIENRYGKYIETGYYWGGRYYKYSGIPVLFFFENGGKISTFMANSGIEVKGAKVGMTFNQIKDILGKPLSEGYDNADGENLYSVKYEVNNHEVTFFSNDKNQATNMVMVNM